MTSRFCQWQSRLWPAALLVSFLDAAAQRPQLAAPRAEFAKPVTQGALAGGGSWLLNPDNVGLTLQVQLPSDVPSDPEIQLTYTGSSGSLPEFITPVGVKWTDTFRRSTKPVSPPSVASVDLFGGDGRLMRYSGLSGGVYTPPAQAKNGLTTLTAGGWRETRPDGQAYAYNSNGTLTYLQLSTGARWTAIYDANQRLSALADPFARRTTWSYDGSGRIKTLVRSTNRRFSFVVDGSGNLTRVIRPDNSRITIGYTPQR